MNSEGFALFETRYGACGIAWGERGIVGVQLPEADEAATRARMHKRFSSLKEGAPPPDVRAAMARITHFLGGAIDDLGDLDLDWHGVNDFQRRVYELARRIPLGETRTYGQIAGELGDKNLARAVGQALGQNPFAPVVPCHRVLAAGGKTGGFSAHGGTKIKMRMLAVEGAEAAALSGTGSLFSAQAMRQP
ncbi:methylated-DNA--[protein]-cysteine S-methyltransferase [Variovorax dokdonensis]|uniref:Methylated-DNA--[protein]-cysteine S-methyltransferase n=1 Tax=Variovorax dokdonensis TaxID=344883 RepID=A0ABT7NGV1_9BURK|nr:methylated-DNA--[protein]-cysteine S-methyltransferase [Variovorax dokdonensis]MDM0047151.1 methylated-DNA--[protein]-cysteine S-methyltransferase [Variovorax dokdonensis]